MVLPFDRGELVRSLVRVPGSGTDKKAGSECLDLSKVSSLVAAIRTPSELPPALISPKVNPPPPPSKMVADEVVAAGIIPKQWLGKRPSPSLPNDVPPKKARLIFMTVEEVKNNASRITVANTSSGPILSMKSTTPISPPLDLTQVSLADLNKELDRLRQERKELEKRRDDLIEVMKDKTKLKHLIQHL